MRAIGAAEDIVLGRPAHIIANEKVQQSIPIIIKPQSGSAEALTPEQATRARGVHESTSAGVAKKSALPHASDENVGETIIIVIADGHAHAVDLDVEAGASRHVRKRAVAVVPVEPQRGSLALVSGPVHAVHQQDVLPAIAVIIKERAARAQSLRQQLAAIGAAVVPKLDSRSVRHVGQAESQSSRGLRKDPRWRCRRS